MDLKNTAKMTKSRISARAKEIADRLEVVGVIASGIEIGTCVNISDYLERERQCLSGCEDYDRVEGRCIRYDKLVKARLEAARN